MDEQVLASMLRFDERPPDPPGWIPVRRPKAGQTNRGTLLMNGYLGHGTHYVGGRSVCCVGKEKGCPWCGNRKWIWEAYTITLDERDRRMWIEAISAGAIRNCWGAQQGMMSRGRRIEVSREKDKNCGSVKLVIGDPAPRIEQYPEAPDLASCLSRMWGIALLEAWPELSPDTVADTLAETALGRRLEEEIPR